MAAEISALYAEIIEPYIELIATVIGVASGIILALVIIGAFLMFKEMKRIEKAIILAIAMVFGALIGFYVLSAIAAFIIIVAFPVFLSVSVVLYGFIIRIFGWAGLPVVNGIFASIIAGMFVTTES